MNKILVLYPKLFKSYSKFERKLNNILKNIQDFELYALDDYNGFLSSYCKDNNFKISLTDKCLTQFTHAIIFDDGKDFQKEYDFFTENNIPLRLITIKITRVININKDTQYKNLKSTAEYEYIGRGSYWGNPYSMYEDSESREDVIRKFKYDFDKDIFPKKEKKNVYHLAGKTLGCFCKPEDCHGDVLADYLNSWDDGN